MHHAYLIGRRMEGEERKDFVLEKAGVEERDADILIFEDTHFKLDRASEVREAILTKPYEGKTRLIILSFITINGEAQNALLKMIEEPGEQTIFFIMTEAPERLLPTIHSRLENVTWRQGLQVETEELKNSIAELLTQSAKIVEDIKEGKIGKDKALEFLDICIREARERKKRPAILHELIAMRSYLLDQSSSVKQILESAVALSF